MGCASGWHGQGRGHLLRGAYSMMGKIPVLLGPRVPAHTQQADFPLFS